LPENLLEKVFACWFEFAGHEKESEIEEAARHTDRSSLPGGLGSLVYGFWQRRPTRLFSLLTEYHPEKPQAWFSFLDLEARRLPLVLSNISYSSKQLEHLHALAVRNAEHGLERTLNGIINNRLMPVPSASVNRPAVPLLIDSDNQFYPRVIFDRFSDDFSLFLHLSSDSQVIAKHRRVCELFTHRLSPGKLLMPLLPLMCFPFPGFSFEGNSFEMGLWVSLWLAAHSWPQGGNICCTGTICSKTGRIGKVSRLEEKLDAALGKGFSKCLVPAEGFISTRYVGDSRVVAINDVDELNDWLLQNTGVARQTRRVVSWMQSDRNEPGIEDFTEFFNSNALIETEPAAHWKTLLRHQPTERRMHRLKQLVRSFCSLPDGEVFKTLAFLPAALRYACLPWILKKLLQEKPAAAEALYLVFSRRYAESSPEIYHASRFLIEKPYFYLLAERDFIEVRHRFPLLLWLFFREPSEMLLAFSLLEQLNSVEKGLLGKLIALLARHAEAYVSDSTRQRIDARIMQKLLQRIDPEARFRPGPVLTVRKRLLYLWHAAAGFAAAGNNDAAECCRKLLDRHLNFLTAMALPGYNLKETFARGTADAEAMQKMTEIPAMHDLLHAVRSSKCSIENSKLLQKKLPDPFVTCKTAITGKSPDLLWLPQPGSACLRAVLNGSWPDLNFFGIIRQFTCNSYRTPASELREASLAFWAGTITRYYVDSADSLLKSRHFRNAGSLSLPFIAGWLHQEYLIGKALPCDTCRKLVKTDLLSTGSLIWLLLLPAKCFACLRPGLVAKISSAGRSSDNKQLRRKNDIYVSMFQTLLTADENSPEAQLWVSSLDECLKNPSQARRTVQALAPFYFLLKGARQMAWRQVRKCRYLVNNSEFTLAFLLRFTRLGKPDFRVQPVPDLSLSLEKQLLDSLTLAYYHLFKPGLFKTYVLSEVDDLSNLRIISL